MSERPAKAVLYRLKETKAGTAEKPPTVKVDGDPIPVQFNPTSLKIDRSNDTSGGPSTRAQRRNRPNEGHATLTLDLEYDTAEGGPDGRPLDVRTRTQDVRQFAEPPKDKPKQAPPRLRFVWGSLTFDGIVTRVGEEIDYFSVDGMALRAKVSLTITEQNLQFESNAAGPGARTDSAATRPGGASSRTGPGSTPTRTPDTAVDAQDGESVQQAMSRAGLDPAAWRSAMSGLDSPLGIGAGVQVQLDASVTAGAGLGVTTGFSAGLAAGATVGLSAAASAGLAAGVAGGAGLSIGAGAAAAAGASGSAGAGLVIGAGPVGGAGSAGAGGTAAGAVGASAQVAAGFALSAVGGIDAAAQGVLAAQVEAEVAAARASFAVPASASAPASVSAPAFVPTSAAASASAAAAGSAAASAAASAPASAAASVSAAASAVAAASAAASAAAGARAGGRAGARVDTRALTYGRGVPLKPPATVR